MDLLGLVMEQPPTAEVVAGWTPEQAEEASYWAANAHLAASDNDVTVPPRPSFITSPHVTSPDVIHKETALEALASAYREDGETPVGEAFIRYEEWHVTVEGVSVLAWLNACLSYGEGTRSAGLIKPLVIELNDGRIQLMMVTAHNPAGFISFLEDSGVKVIRFKHEVSALLPGETAMYYEAHAKLDGTYRPDRRGSSRDVLRASGMKGRWYLTRRRPEPFDHEEFRVLATNLGKGSRIDSIEFEAVLMDTNPALDNDWRVL